MLPLQSPLEAYRADLSRHPNRMDFGRSDTVWLLVAHCLHRLSRAQGEARRSIAENCASAIGDLAGADLGRPYPCMGFIRVQIYRNNVYFGHVVSSYFIGSVDIQPNQNGVPVGYMDVSWGVQGYVRSAWNGCQ